MNPSKDEVEPNGGTSPAMGTDADPKSGNERDPAANFILKLRQHPIIAALIVIGTIVIAIGAFTDALDKIEKRFSNEIVTDNRILNDVKQYGIYQIKISGLLSQYAPKETVHFEVQCDNQGYLWIFSPYADNPNLLFPCPSLDDCRSAVKKETHRLKTNIWRKLPQATDPRVIQAGPYKGPDDLVVIVTKENAVKDAYAALKAIRPDLNIKATVGQTSLWGGATTRWDVVE